MPAPFNGTRKLRPGKMIYYYRLTPAAAEFVKSIPDYEQDEDFGANAHIQDSVALESSTPDQDNTSEKPSPDGTPSPNPKGLPVAAAIKRLLGTVPNGLKSGQIVAAIVDEIDSKASNRTHTITSGLYSLKKSGKITHDESTGIYKLSKE